MKTIESKTGYYIKIRKSIVVKAKELIAEDKEVKSFNDFLEKQAEKYIESKKLSTN